MEIDEVRQRSLKLAAGAGLSISPALPLLDAGLRARGEDEVTNRLLCLTAVAAASFGFDRTEALAWLRQENLVTLLTDAESRFLREARGNPQTFQTQVESMWALAWALNIVSNLDFWQDCDDTFVTKLPNLKARESGAELRRRSCMQPVDDLISACDLAYCLHWAVRQAELGRKPPPLKPYVVIERRRALEWLPCDGP